jgi:hypothetical protein
MGRLHGEENGGAVQDASTAKAASCAPRVAMPGCGLSYQMPQPPQAAQLWHRWALQSRCKAGKKWVDGIRLGLCKLRLPMHITRLVVSLVRLWKARLSTNAVLAVQ